MKKRIKKEQWHNLPIEEVFLQLKTTDAGLSQKEAQKRLDKYGRNELPPEKGHSVLYLFFIQFASPLMYIMMLAIGVLLYIGNITEAVFVFVVMLSNAIVGFYQEHKANKSLAALKNIIEQSARVIRDNGEFEVNEAQIVPGDILVLRVGDRVPADGRILEHRGLKINEANLTGEAKPVSKTTDIVPLDVEVADRINMVFMGTLIEEGSATVLVVSTGAKTEYGDIVSLLADTPEESTPLQKTVVSLSKLIGVIISLIVGIIIIEGYFAGHSFKIIFETALALFVSAIPEGLLPAITIVLVLGMRRILKQKGLVRRLASTETLGGVTVICTDKTGTLTEGKMQVERVITADGVHVVEGSSPQMLSPVVETIYRTTIMATDAFIENPKAPIAEMIVRGNFTEQALMKMSARNGIDIHGVKNSEEDIFTVLFSSENKYSASLRRMSDGKQMLYVVGAPEQVLERVTTVATEGGVLGLKTKGFKEMIQKKDTLTSEGYRVVSCAYRVFPEDEVVETDAMLSSLTLTGFIVLADPVRSTVSEAFLKTQRAGIRTIIITGDHASTALAVAQKIGFTISSNQIMEGSQIEKLTDEELGVSVRTVALFARVSPRHKLRIVTALQKNGEVVAMFGDGVNDAPALKASDIGVAVDTKVDAAREVADIVLLDGGFGTIVSAIEQGRIIFNNIRKVFLYLIVQDFSQFFLFIVSIILGLPLPLIAGQLLLVNLVESGLPDLALTTEQEKEGVMDEPPRNPKESILNKISRRWMSTIFLVSGGIAMLFYAVTFSLTGDIEKTRTMLMVFLCLESLFLVFSVRSFTKGILRKDIFSNRILVWAVGISACMILCAVYILGAQTVLQTVPLSGTEWLIILGLNIVEITLIDFFKIKIFRKKKKVEHVHYEPAYEQ